MLEAAVEENATAANPAARSADELVAREARAVRRRFSRYIDQLSSGGGAGAGSLYPDLHSRPWHNPDGFPLARYLERNFAAIRGEILALDGGRFSRETEPIDRTGDWDVVFFDASAAAGTTTCARPAR